jgi:hypothetical protein
MSNALLFFFNRNDSVSPMNRLLIFLRFVASGSRINLIADNGEMDVSTASRIIKHVSVVIARLRPNFIQMPERQEAIQEVQNAFFNISRFLRVLGCVDGTHIKIQSPGGEGGEVFRNRKLYFSLNVQAVSGPDLKIFDLVAA